ncbi:MAG TPA: gamma-glutamyltransferase [Reyranella sp.]|nr:gamma-glutamyltransferase [Reyranella sp.]
MKPRAGVTASSAAAVEAGARILRQGGNAVDAAVATALAGCVADPGNTGIAGYGGHMIVARSGRAPDCVDFNMWLPAEWPIAALRKAYANGSPDVTAVPNVVAGLSIALQRFGSLSWSAVLEPAIELAESGVVANATSARGFKDVEGAAFVKDCFVFDPLDASGGFRFRQPALAGTLRVLAKEGPQWLYDGPVGRSACEILRNAGSPVTPREWVEAPRAATIVPPAKLDLSQAALYSAPLGTSGSASLFATVTAGAALLDKGASETADSVAAWARAIAGMWSYRFGTAGGNDFSSTTIERWLERAVGFEPARSLTPSVGHTTHLNTCDGTGTLVSVTLTHGQATFGGRWAVPGTGVIMNAGMHLLTAADPLPANGRLYAVTNMNPTVARLGDGSEIAIGCPGARRIPTSVGLALARHLAGGLSLQQAVSRGRFHAESAALASVEMERWDVDTVDALRRDFAAVEDEGPRGPLTAIRREADGTLSFGLDDRAGQGFAAVP